MQMSFKCEEAATSNDCSSTYDFNHVFISRAYHAGYYPRELLPTAYYENNDPTTDPKCLVFGTSGIGGTKTHCFHCMSVIEKNDDSEAFTF